MGFVDKSSRAWVSTDKKVGQDAEGKGSGLEWGKFYYVAISVENLKNNTKSYWVFIAVSRVDTGPESSKIIIKIIQRSFGTVGFDKRW
jgi:hypothetical protein